MIKGIEILLLCVGYVAAQDFGNVGGTLTVDQSPPGGQNFDTPLESQNYVEDSYVDCSQCSKKEGCSLGIANKCQFFYRCNGGVAVQQKCAFGTFFVKDKGCMHSLDAKCLADPCLVNPNLTSYHDEGHCRTYWECKADRKTRKQFSKPKCCPEGSLYSTTERECVHDVEGTCNEVCELKKGSHVVLQKKTLRAIICENEEKSLFCDTKYEIRIQSVNWGRTSPNFCNRTQDIYNTCQSNVATDDVLQTCHRRRRCVLSVRKGQYADPCPSISKYLDVAYKCVASCRLRPAGTHAYFNGNTKTHCPRFTRYSQKHCTCISTGIPAHYEVTCQLHVNITFNNDSSFEDKDGRKVLNYKPYHIDYENVERINNYAKFWGNTYVCAPFYKNNDNLSKQFGIQLRVLAANVFGSQIEEQYLISNCYRVQPDIYDGPLAKSRWESSLDIILRQNNATHFTIVFRVIDIEDKPHSIELPMRVQSWTNVIYHFDSEDLHAKIQHYDEDLKRTITFAGSTPFAGREMKRSSEGLCVGGCKRSRRMHKPFYGFIDEIQISPCKAKQVTAERP